MTIPSRRLFLRIAGIGLLTTFGQSVSAVARAPAAALHLYKSPYCGCCQAWGQHMRGAGFSVVETNVEDLDPLKQRLGIPPELRSCHTATVQGYVVEGHVPAKDVLRMLSERPAATGLAVPGMPIGSPGMEQGQRIDPYSVVLFSPDRKTIFSRYR